MMKRLRTLLFLAAVVAVPGRGEIEPVGEAGPEVSVIVCGEVTSPKKITLSSGAGVRGALLLADGASEYGWAPRTRIWRLDRIYQIGPPNEPDVRLEEGDVIEIPLRAPYEEMARPHQVLIEVDSRTEFTAAVFTQSHFEVSGTWRTNWWGGIKGRELRLTDQDTYHSTFVCPCPSGF